MVKYLWTPPPPQRLEAAWLHPVPLAFKLNTTARHPREWSILELGRPVMGGDLNGG